MRKERTGSGHAIIVDPPDAARTKIVQRDDGFEYSVDFEKMGGACAI